MSWKIAKVGVGTVTLPWGPDAIYDEVGCVIDKAGVDGGGAVLFARYDDARMLTFEGNIWLHGSTNASLESAYLGSLRGFKRGSCTITDPDNQYGGTWLFSNFKTTRIAEGAEVRYAYTMEFLLGSYTVIL